MIRRMLPLLLSALALAACASTPVYGPAARAGASGYSERQIENDRFYITYNAPNGADAQLLQDYALLRAADITIEHGRDWFWVDRRALDENPYQRSGPQVGLSVGGASFGGHSATGVGVGLSFPLGGGGAQRAHSATIEMRLGSGPKPDQPNAFDARATAANLRPRTAQPR